MLLKIIISGIIIPIERAQKTNGGTMKTSRARIQNLEAKHQKLDEKLQELQRSPSVPSEQVTAIKKEKLALKDTIAQHKNALNE